MTLTFTPSDWSTLQTVAVTGVNDDDVDGNVAYTIVTRRECLDHMIVLNERHLHLILTGYFDYYHNSRPHLSLDRNSPTPRRIEPPSEGQCVAIPQVGGSHHRYTRAA